MKTYMIIAALSCLFLFVLAQAVRLFLIKNDLRRMREELEKTREDSYNRNLRVTFSDKDVEKLAIEINKNLDHQKELKLRAYATHQ